MYWSAALVALLPPGVVTVTSTVPTVPAGAVAVIVVELVTVKVAAAVPKSTAVAPVKPVPVTVTVVPPALVPELGATAADRRGGRRRTARDGHVLDLVDVVAPARAPGEADQHVRRQRGGVTEDLCAVHGHGDARRGGRHHEVVHGISQRRDVRVGGDVVQLVAGPRDGAVGNAHEVVRRVDSVLVGVHRDSRDPVIPE